MAKFEIGDKVRVNISKVADGDYKETCLNPMMRDFDGRDSIITKVRPSYTNGELTFIYELDLDDAEYPWNWHEDWLEPIEKPTTDQVTAHNILLAASQHMIDRGKTYDKEGGERSMSATVEAFKAVTGVDLTESQGWTFMALLKAVRANQRTAYHADSYEDMAAYVGLAAEAKAQEGYTNEIN